MPRRHRAALEQASKRVRECADHDVGALFAENVAAEEAPVRKCARLAQVSAATWQALADKCAASVQVYEEISAADYETAAPIEIHDYMNVLRQFGRGIGAKGHKLFTDIQETLSRFRVNPEIDRGRGDDQIRMHNKILEACIPLLFGDEWERNPDAIMRMYGLEKLWQYLLLGTPRRLGKTILVAMFVTAFAYHCPTGKRINIFAQNGRTSQEMLGRIMFFASQLPDGGQTFIGNARSSDTIIVSKTKQRDDKNPTIIKALPSGGNNLRGMGADLTIAEEMAFISARTMCIAVAPALARGNAVFIGISSNPPETYNYFNMLMEAKDEETGENVFLSNKITLMCAACTQANANDCKHMEHRQPWYRTRSSAAVIKAMMSTMPWMYKIEMLGMSGNENIPCFEAQMLKRIFHDPMYSVPIRECVPFVFIAVDITTGGMSSNMGLVSCCYTFTKELVFLGAEEVPLTDPSGLAETKAIVAHIDTLRKIEWFRHAVMVAVVEANAAWVVSHKLAGVIKAHSPATAMSDDPQGLRDGMFIDHKVKEQMTDHMHMMLQANKVFVYRHFVSHTPSQNPMGREALERQLCQWEMIPPKGRSTGGDAMPNRHGEMPMIYSGKGRGENDDVAVAALEGALYGAIFITDPRRTLYFNVDPSPPITGVIAEAMSREKYYRNFAGGSMATEPFQQQLIDLVRTMLNLRTE